jgi:para-nitrobenzyl esterase
MRRVLGTVAVAAALATSAAAQPAPGIPTARVKVESGELVGLARDSANVFRDIPYAAPPIGPLRWKPPQPAEAWSGERQAMLPGPSCPQPMKADGAPNDGGANGPTSEDCLQLNVFAPKDAKHAPVMVWLHGGGHRTGAGWIYDGSNFARDGVVLVAINYRLGALGYFAHPALTKDAGDAPVANYGLMDQIAALKWVKRNIAAFGGDPNNVTIFGESAGGVSTLALLATPAGKGLYSKAIVESGGGWFLPTSVAKKEADGVKALATIGVPATATAKELRTIPVEKLAALEADYNPIADGRLLPETPTQALAHGRFADVPLIIGSNSGEDSLMGPGPVPAERAAYFLPPDVKTAYADEAARGGDQLVARAAFADRIFTGPARWIAAKASDGQPAWLYHFSYIGDRFRPAKTRASHADEIQYVFEYWGRRTPMSVVSDEDKQMAKLMHACWVAFAKTGQPKCGTEPWPAYSPAKDQLMEFGASSGVRTNFRKVQLDAQAAAMTPMLALGPAEPTKAAATN